MIRCSLNAENTIKGSEKIQKTTMKKDQQQQWNSGGPSLACFTEFNQYSGHNFVVLETVNYLKNNCNEAIGHIT